MIFGENFKTCSAPYTMHGTNLTFVHSNKISKIMSRLKIFARMNTVIGTSQAVNNNLLRCTLGRSVDFLLAVYILHRVII